MQFALERIPSAKLAVHVSLKAISDACLAISAFEVPSPNGSDSDVAAALVSWASLAKQVQGFCGDCEVSDEVARTLTGLTKARKQLWDWSLCALWACDGKGLSLIVANPESSFSYKDFLTDKMQKVASSLQLVQGIEEKTKYLNGDQADFETVLKMVGTCESILSASSLVQGHEMFPGRF